MIKVHYRRNEHFLMQNPPPAELCVLRPTPLISISMAPERNKDCMTGVLYTVTLTGTLLADEGLPYAPSSGGTGNGIADVYPETGSVGTLIGPFNAFDDVPISQRPRPPKQKIHHRSHALLGKQRVLRSLFARDGQIVSVSDVDDSTLPVIWFYSRFVSISFDEGQYTDTCTYTITLETDHIAQGTPGGPMLVEAGNFFCLNDPEDEDEQNNPDEATGIDNFTDEWNLEVEDSALHYRPYYEWTGGTDKDPPKKVERQFENDLHHLRTYRITHTVSANGKAQYDNLGRITVPAWQRARNFVTGRATNYPLHLDQNDNFNGYPNTVPNQPANPNDPDIQPTVLSWNNLFLPIATFPISVGDGYTGYNHLATESIDKTGGSFTLTESWLLSAYPATETSTVSLNHTKDEALPEVTVEGTIKGHKLIIDNSLNNAGNFDPTLDLNLETVGPSNNPFLFAKTYYNNITKDGSFGWLSEVWARANEKFNQTFQGQIKPDNTVMLGQSPLSATVSFNEHDAEINYTVTYGGENAVENFISNALSESISIDDTYPGDVFSSVAVLSRPNGPILQYLGGRTEYKRNLTINLVMNNAHLMKNTTDKKELFKKPSQVAPTDGELAQIIAFASPKGEDGVLKYFISPPTESWNPKDGTYSLNLSWTYELDK